MEKPITVERQDYMRKIVEITNATALPAFVKVGVLEQALKEMRKIEDSELKRDLNQYMEAKRAAQESTGGVTDENQRTSTDHEPHVCGRSPD